MQQEMQIESRSYDLLVRGRWQGYRVDESRLLGDEHPAEKGSEPLRLWLPAGTLMRWSTGQRALRNNCLQFIWPQRWYMLSAFYDQCVLMYTYANIIQPATIEYNRLSYVDLDLSVLVEPDLSYKVLTQVEFEQMAEILHYDEQTRISALMALRTLTSSIQRSVGIFTNVPHTLRQADCHMVQCS
jgi:protein associated with RNAse G/E